MNGRREKLLIVDYNLSRVADVAHMRDYARCRYNVDTLLVRGNPGEMDARLCDHVVGVDPLLPDFVAQACEALSPWRDHIRGGIVFSDNAVQSGAALLERIGLQVDSASLALGAFSKFEYRRAEARCRDLLESQRVMTPNCVLIRSLEELRQFAEAHPEGFVIKPSCEGNNRGVVMMRPGDSLVSALEELTPYLAAGVICEQVIPYRREYSFDGLGGLSFITEKVSASGRYPVEVAQVLPARLGRLEQETIRRAGECANWLVGQRDGPFHNEIKLSDDGMFAAVVEPNRRPAGMKIWSLAALVYGIDFYHLWIDSVLGDGFRPSTLEARCQAATVMLGVKHDRWFAPSDVASGSEIFPAALERTARQFGLPDDALRSVEFSWLSQERRYVPSIARDNSDFVASACVSLHESSVSIGDIVSSLRERWTEALESAMPADVSIREADIPVRRFA
ncbi:ATP-grasp domain-containing protein [Caballeronia ptereochthonis]|uniref:Argininosuccinate lyase n=1 Tax=Caballeronia ptereochthonis TaxID=1777144 RepID=A0A158DZL0_9BURK|nr:biotin carboxylase [Caballeronia ptereochthonis]SAK99994.1 argininosuccinate lyase [Caballeronia ptereochthonis]